MGANPIILPDKLPENRNKLGAYELEGKINILCVSTYGDDEPIKEIIAAIKNLPDNYRIYMTGDYKKMQYNLIQRCSSKLIFTGFLNEKKYWDLLNSVDFVIDLTKRGKLFSLRSI